MKNIKKIIAAVLGFIPFTPAGVSGKNNANNLTEESNLNSRVLNVRSNLNEGDPNKRVIFMNDIFGYEGKTQDMSSPNIVRGDFDNFMKYFPDFGQFVNFSQFSNWNNFRDFGDFHNY